MAIALPRSRRGPAVLPPRQRVVLDLLMLGFTYRKIAGELGISVRTVETHRRYLGEKTGAKTRAELFRWALDEGVGPLVSRTTEICG